MGIESKMQRAEKCGELVRPVLCENCKEERKLVRHHRDYNKPLRITWLCHRCHRIEHKTCTIEGLPERHPVQYDEPLWGLLQRAAANESVKQGKIVTAAEYTRQIVSRHLRRKR